MVKEYIERGHVVKTMIDCVYLRIRRENDNDNDNLGKKRG